MVPDNRRRPAVSEVDAGNDTGDTAKKRRKSEDSSSSLQERWEEMFERLRRYKETKGNCNVPNRYPEDPQLGFWVSTQRRQYRVLTSGGSTSSALTVQRAQKLMNLGFEWSAKDPRMVPWETRFNQLKEFVSKNGHAQVPIGWEENVPLSNWVSKQRQEYKLLQKGKASRLTQERINKLDEIGFVWEAKRGAPRQVILTTDRPVSSSALQPSSPEKLRRTSSSSSHASAPRSIDHEYGSAEPLSPQRNLRGMGPASPPSTSSAPGPNPPSLPSATLPAPIAPKIGFSTSAEASYHGSYQPRAHEYYSHHPSSQPFYPPPPYSPPYPHAPPSYRPHPHESFSSQMGPPPPPLPPAGWPRTGRVLTPLYPMEHTPIPGYLVSSSSAGVNLTEPTPPLRSGESSDHSRREEAASSEAQQSHGDLSRDGNNQEAVSRSQPPPHHHDERGPYY